MKKLLFIAFASLLLPICFTAQVQSTATESSKVHWVTLSEALELQKKSPKKIMMDVYTKWCGPCKMMAQNTFNDDEVAAYLNEHYYAVKFDAESSDTVIYNGQTFSNPNFNPQAVGRNSQHQLATYLQVQAYPTLVFIDEKGVYLGPVTGYRTPPQIELFLKFFALDEFKTITTPEQWQQYQNGFVPTWN